MLHDPLIIVWLECKANKINVTLCDETRHKSESSPTTNPAHRLTRENTYKKNNTKRLLKQYSQSSRF